MIRKKREMPRSLYDVRRQPHTDGLAPPTYATSDDVARTNQISKNTPVSQQYICRIANAARQILKSTVQCIHRERFGFQEMFRLVEMTTTRRQG